MAKFLRSSSTLPNQYLSKPPDTHASSKLCWSSSYKYVCPRPEDRQGLGEKGGRGREAAEVGERA